MSANNNVQSLPNKDQVMGNREDDNNEEDLAVENQLSMGTMLMEHSDQNGGHQFQGRNININGIAFIANLNQGVLLDFDSLMGLFGAVLKRGHDTPIGAIRPSTPHEMAQSANGILAAQRLSHEPCANKDGIQRPPKKVSSVLACKANTVASTFSHAFANQFEEWMSQSLTNKDRNRFIQGLLADMKNTHPCLRHCIVPDPPNSGQAV